MQKYTKNLKKSEKKTGLRTIKLFLKKKAQCCCDSTKTDYRQAESPIRLAKPQINGD